MQKKPSTPKTLRYGAGVLATLQVFASFPIAAYAQNAGAAKDNSTRTRTPIKHVIVIIGENRTFDHIFATYKPKQGETIDNLLSRHIINTDGTPGANYSYATQYSAEDTHRDKYENSPQQKSFYQTLPVPLAGGPSVPYVSTVAEAEAVENGLAPEYYKYLTTGGTGLKAHTPDTRILNYNNLPPGPFQLTPGIPYDAYAGSPVHRYYQMAQELDCNADYATRRNPSGCKADLFPYVEVSVGAGTNGEPQPKPFTDETTGEGSLSMGFYNMQQGDVPYLKALADSYAISDNYHQAILGGTGANHIAIGTGDAIWFSNGNGMAARPPHDTAAGALNEIENPNPMPHTDNWYTQDGYGTGTATGGGSYSNCSDSDAPGVKAMQTYLGTLPYEVDPKCDAGHYYLLNNYNPGYYGDGKNAFTDTAKGSTVFTVPPSSVRNIGDALLEKNVSWKYYGDQYNRYLADPYYKNPTTAYCNICNFFQYSTSIMTNAAVRTAHLQDTVNLYQDIQSGNLPAVSFVKPSGFVDGHPSSSKLDLFEGFVKKIVDGVQANPELWKDTAIIVTVDEGGGYYDSGYVQPVDFFGDGTRIPLIVVSPYTKAGHVSHQYNDHVSILKFIEANWGLDPITKRSRDNLPNPVQDRSNPYVPTNGPAIGDLMDLFDFNHNAKQDDYGNDHDFN
jgi:phospholipase C